MSRDIRRNKSSGWVLRYGLAIISVAAGFYLRLLLTEWVGPGLATYITFYPAVIAAALTSGLGPGLLATALTNLVVGYWVIKPGEHPEGIDLAGQVIFALMGVMISITAEYYQRLRTRAALINAQDALTRSEEKYRRLFQNMWEGFALYEMQYDKDGMAVDWKVLEINEAYTRHTGVTPESIVGQNISKTFPQTYTEYLPIFAAVTANRTSHEFEAYVKPTGRHLKIVTFPLSGAYFANIVEDITEKKKAQEALRRSEADFRLLSETAEQLIMWKDIQAVVNSLCRKTMEHLDCQVFFNFLADKKAGKLRLNAFAGIPDQEAQKMEWLDYGVAVCGCAAQAAVPIIADNIFTTPDPRTELVKSFGVQAYACHPLMIQGEVIGTLSFGSRTRASFSENDVLLMKKVTTQVATAMERARLLDEQQKLREELESKVRERTADLKNSFDALKKTNMEMEEFIHVASHDLQEPLRKIMTFTEKLATLKTIPLDEQAADYLSRTYKAAARMQLLIQDLVKYSRVTSSISHFEIINLRLPLEDAVMDLSVPLEETEGRIEIDELPEVNVDRIQISQLFVNLINNALKYRGSEKPVIRIFTNSSSDARFHEIHVMDNGIGFDELYLERIFKPFQRLHGRSSPYQGTGMGLAICRKILENHNGSITATSIPGEGSTFIIKLPKVPQKF